MNIKYGKVSYAFVHRKTHLISIVLNFRSFTLETFPMKCVLRCVKLPCLILCSYESVLMLLTTNSSLKSPDKVSIVQYSKTSLYNLKLQLLYLDNVKVH
jgi:hypothetical protein